MMFVLAAIMPSPGTGLGGVLLRHVSPVLVEADISPKRANFRFDLLGPAGGGE
jgi:hypothetical protein